LCDEVDISNSCEIPPHLIHRILEANPGATFLYQNLEANFKYSNGQNLRHKKKKASSNRIFNEKEVIVDEKDFVEGYSVRNIIIGEGCFGTVRKCKCRKSGQFFAVKSVKKCKRLKSQRRDLFNNEVSILRQLSHPNIMKFICCHESDSSVHIVTELCNGGDLYDRMMSQGKLAEKEVKKHAAQMFEAIAYCHQKGVVHRDIKPENFMFRKSPLGTSLVLIDFGFSTYLPVAKRAHLHTMCGSLHYVAPEVLLRNYTEKCDIWAVGVILYASLSGFFPFDGETQDEIFENVKTADLIFYDQDFGHVSPEAKDLISCLLNRCDMSRFSATQALNHSFLRTKTKNPFQLPRTNSPLPVQSSATQALGHSLYKHVDPGVVELPSPSHSTRIEAPHASIQQSYSKQSKASV